jgi:hypothetical protein
MLALIPEGRNVPAPPFTFSFPRFPQHRIYNIKSKGKKTFIKPPTVSDIINYFHNLSCGKYEIGNHGANKLILDRKMGAKATIIQYEVLPKNDFMSRLKIIIISSPRIYDVTDKSKENIKKMKDDAEHNRDSRISIKLTFTDWLNYQVKNPDVPDIQNIDLNVTQEEIKKINLSMIKFIENVARI